MTPTSLFLSPADPWQAFERPVVAGALKDLAVVGEPLDRYAYLTGDGFARHIVFAGCAPHLALDPPADGSSSFTHVVLHGPFDGPRLQIGPNTVGPRCPSCRARFDDWRSTLPAWRDGRAPVRCPACGRTAAVALLDWRGHAIAARSLIEVCNVFPGEAAPSDALLQALQTATATPWRYAWAGQMTAPR